MRVLKLNIYNGGSRQGNLLSVTIFMVAISFTEISAPSFISSNVNRTSLTHFVPTVANKRQWLRQNLRQGAKPSDNSFKTMNYTSTIKTSGFTRNVIHKSFHTSNVSVETTQNAFNVSEHSGHPLSKKSRTPRLENLSEFSNKETKYAKIFPKHLGEDSRERHWQPLRKPGTIVAQKDKNLYRSQGFGWGQGHVDSLSDYPPVSWQYHKITTPLTVVNPSEQFYVSTTPRPPLIFNSLPNWNQATFQPSMTRQPSHTIGKISALHWGSSGLGSTLPSHEFQQSYGYGTGGTLAPPTAPSIQNTIVSPYSQQYGNEHIVGNSFATNGPTSVWYKPTLNQYTTTVAPILLTARPGDQMLNSNNIVQAIPAVILSGLPINGGAALNSPAATLQTGNFVERNQWQQVPVVLSVSPSPVGWGWNAPTNPTKAERPISVNYVVWGSSTTPSPTLIVPTDFQKYFQDYLNRIASPAPPKQDSDFNWLLIQNYIQNQMSTRAPSVQGQNPLRAVGSNLANLALVQLVLSFLNRQSDPQTQLQSDAVPGSHQVGSAYSGNKHYGYPVNNHGYPIAITEGYSHSGESYTKTLVPKTEKRKRRKRKRRRRKKCRKYKNHRHRYSGLLGWLQPGNLDFNYDFKIDFYDILKKKFYALAALQLAPVIIISIAAVLPLAFLIWPQVFKLIKYAIVGDKPHIPFYPHHHLHGHNPYYPYKKQAQELNYQEPFYNNEQQNLASHYQDPNFYQGQGQHFFDYNGGYLSNAQNPPFAKRISFPEYDGSPISRTNSSTAPKFGDGYSLTSNNSSKTEKMVNAYSQKWDPKINSKHQVGNSDPAWTWNFGRSIFTAKSSHGGQSISDGGGSNDKKHSGDRDVQIPSPIL